MIVSYSQGRNKCYYHYQSRLRLITISQTLIISGRACEGDFLVERSGMLIISFRAEQKLDFGVTSGVQDKMPLLLAVKASLKVKSEDKKLSFGNF